MGWRGMLAGSILGSCRGGLVGSLVGAFLGSYIEDRFVLPRLRRGRKTQGETDSAVFQDDLARAYETLGARPSDSMETLKRKYHALAKKYHPDTIRAQGLSDVLMRQANERMERINSAWSILTKYRRP